MLILVKKFILYSFSHSSAMRQYDCRFISVSTSTGTQLTLIMHEWKINLDDVIFVALDSHRWIVSVIHWDMKFWLMHYMIPDFRFVIWKL